MISSQLRSCRLLSCACYTTLLRFAAPSELDLLVAALAYLNHIPCINCRPLTGGWAFVCLQWAVPCAHARVIRYQQCRVCALSLTLSLVGVKEIALHSSFQLVGVNLSICCCYCCCCACVCSHFYCCSKIYLTLFFCPALLSALRVLAAGASPAHTWHSYFIYLFLPPICWVANIIAWVLWKLGAHNERNSLIRYGNRGSTFVNIYRFHR